MNTPVNGVPPRLPPLPPLPLRGPPPLPRPRPTRGSRLRLVLNVALWACLAGLVAYNVATGGRAFQPAEALAQAPWREGEPWRRPLPRRGMGWHAPAISTPLPTNLARIRIELSPEAEDALRSQDRRVRGFGMGLDPNRVEVQGIVHCDGQAFTNVAIHLKGAAGSFRPYDDKPAFTLHFSKHAKGQSLRGMPKVSLNNSVQDPTFLSEAICRRLYREAGVPVPRTDHVTVEVNGRDLGLYVLAEGWGKDFLRQHFPDPDGNLYDGGFVQDVFDRPLDVVSGKHKDRHPGLGRLERALGMREPGPRWAALTNALDVDRFLSLAVVDMFTCNWDGYGFNRNNYRIYDDPAGGRLVFMPHGLDQTFGTGQRMPPNASIRSPMRAQVAAAVLEHPEGRRRYLARFAQLTNAVLREDTILQHAREIAARIRPTLHAYSPAVAQDHDEWVEDYGRRIGERARSVLDQLSTPIPKPNLATRDASALLREWRPHGARRTRAGAVECERVATDDGPRLVVRLPVARASGAWRTLLLLDPGSYRVTGRVRVGRAGPGAQVFLAANGEPAEPAAVVEDGWTPIETSLHVDQPGTEVQLSAEFQGARGEVAFDAEGFVITRLDGPTKAP